MIAQYLYTCAVLLQHRGFGTELRGVLVVVVVVVARRVEGFGYHTQFLFHLCYDVLLGVGGLPFSQDWGLGFSFFFFPRRSCCGRS